MERIHLFVSGLVQGVGFRAATRREANRLGLFGWVRNTPDGRVEITVMGAGASLESFLKWCERGPIGSSVSRVDILDRAAGDATEFKSFEISGCE